MSETPLNETNLDGLKEIEQLGKDFKNDYKIISLYLENAINRFHRYILKPVLIEKTVECVTKNSFLLDNEDLYNEIRNNGNVLVDGSSLPDGYTDTTIFLTDYDTTKDYTNINCKDEYEVEFHQNISLLYNEAEMLLIREKYDNMVEYKEMIINEQIKDNSDIFDINSRLNGLVLSALSSLLS